MYGVWSSTGQYGVAYVYGGLRMDWIAGLKDFVKRHTGNHLVRTEWHYGLLKYKPYSVLRIKWTAADYETGALWH